MTVLVLTNGYVLTEDHVKEAKQLGIALSINLDSVNNDIFDTFREKRSTQKNFNEY